MPIIKDIDRDKNLTIFKVVGLMPFDELRDSIFDYYESGATKLVLFDLRKAKGHGETFSDEKIFELARYLERIRKGRDSGKTALVASEDLLFGICRILEAYQGSSKIEYETFQNIDEAVQWIEK